MARELKDKVVVLTGGASGLGYQITDKYLARGAKVVIVLDLDKQRLADIVDALNTTHGQGRAVGIECDVTKDLEPVTNKIFDKYKSVDVLVNNAGVIDVTSVRRQMDINALAMMEWSMKFWEHMRWDKEGRGGTIVNISSIYGYKVEPYLVFYTASKFAVLGFSKSLGHEYHFNRSGVRVIAICPGFTTTNLASTVEWPDKQLFQDFMEYRKTVVWQEADAVGDAAVEVFEKADSGTAWVIEGSKPVEEVK